MAMVIRICQQCGKDYRTHHTVRLKYCSQACYGLSNRVATMEPCTQCGRMFRKYPSTPNRKYCSISCGITARNLTDQNPAYHRDVSGENNPMFGKGMVGEANPMFGKTKDKAPRWKEGRHLRRDGYSYVVVHDDHPHPSYVKPSGTKYLLEHRHVMEQSLGRYLEPGEVVHHRDGNTSNNSIDNLQLFASQSEHISIGHG